MSSDNDWKHQFIGWFGAVIFILAFCNAAKAAQVVKVLSVFHHRLSPWVTTGTAWGLVNTPRPGIVPHPHPESQAGGEAATGAISSPDFVVEGDLISFLANGWDGRYGGKGLNGYYLIRASDGAVLRRAVPPDEDGFVRITWPVSDLHGQKVYFEAIDRDNNKNGTGDGFAWLGFDKLVMERCEVPANRSHWYSVPLPPGENTWQILQHDGAGRHVAPYLSSLGFGEPGTGAITSPPFVVKGPVIRFTLCGWSGRYGERHASKAELIDARTKAVLQVAAPPLSDALKRYEWNVKDLKGRLVQIRLVDRDPNYSFAWMGLGMVDAKPSYSLNFADESPTKTNGLGLAGWRPQMMQSKQYCQSAGVPFLITRQRRVG
ncbi:MAG: hypothetical protein M1330_01970 [Armatimonadetes bacterium]|nr:hypothetical protein [Armatimonadota bacterium]